MGFDIAETGIFGDAPAAEENDQANLNSEVESDAGALDVDPPEAADQATAATDEDGQPPRKQVPLGALQEERQRRQEANAELAREREQNRVLQERFNQFLMAQQGQQAQQQQQGEVQIPAFAEDPEGHIKALTQQFEQRMAQLTGQTQISVQQQQEQAYRQQLLQEALASEQAYRGKVPDYDAAAKYFTERKTQEYMALGLDAGTAAQRVAQDYYGITAHAKQSGRDPADMLYGLAKAIGYAPSKQPGQQQLQAQNPAPTSLSNLPGAGGATEDDGKLTGAKINAMSDKEFEKLCADMRKAAGSQQRPRT